MKFRKSHKIAIGVILLLVAIRIALPFFIERYVNKVIDEMPGYTGHIDDVDLHIYRGAYAIDGLVLREEESQHETPFLSIQHIDLSVEWKAIWKGAIVGEVVLDHPQLNFVAVPEEPEAEEEPTEEAEHWSETLKDLMPLTVNRFTINGGKIAYLDPNVQPLVNVHMDSLYLTATNLTNVEETPEELPSGLQVIGRTVGGGVLKTEGRLNFLKEIPDLDLNMELTSVDLTALNDFIEAYGKLDIERGRFSLFSELRMKNGQMEGYLKPFFDDLKVLNWEKDKKEDGFFRAVWEAIAGLVSEGVENQPRDQIATQVPIEGNVNQPDTEVWTTALNILKHAFIEAFNKGVEGTIGQE